MGMLDNYIGLPFLSGGRDRAGLDCWGLVLLYYREVLKQELPSLDDEYASAFDSQRVRELVDCTKPEVEAVRTEEPETGDIAVIKLAGIPCHVGVYITPDYVLHIERGKDSCIERLAALRKRARIEGVYRVG